MSQIKLESAAKRVGARRKLVRAAAKWTLIVVGSLLLLLAAAVLVITSVIDPNRYRGRIEAIVGERVGRPIVIEGNLAITWFPWLGLRTGAAHLSNRPGDSGPPLIEWQSIGVAAKVIPLLKGQLVVDRILLESPQVRLRRDARGHGNWEDLTGGAGSGASPQGQARPDSSGKSSRRQGPPPQIAGLEIRNGTLSYVDEASGLQVTLSSLSLEMGEWRAGQSLPLHTRFLLNAGALPPAGLWIEVTAAALDLKLGSPLSVTTPKLDLRVADAELAGDLTYRQADKGEASAHSEASAHGSLVAHTPSLRKLLAQLGLNQTMPHDPDTLGDLELTGTWSYDKGLLSARPVVVKLDGVTLKGWVEHSAAAAQAGWRFELHGDRIDLGRYVNVDSTRKKAFELESLRTLNANGSLTFDEAQLAESHLADVRLRVETPEVKQ